MQNSMKNHKIGRCCLIHLVRTTSDLTRGIFEGITEVWGAEGKERLNITLFKLTCFLVWYLTYLRYFHVVYSNHLFFSYSYSWKALRSLWKIWKMQICDPFNRGLQGWSVFDWNLKLPICLVGLYQFNIQNCLSTF